MPSFTHRYNTGEHRQVWQELRALGPVPAAQADDVAEVAALTMRRANAQLLEIEDALSATGYVRYGDWLDPDESDAELLAGLAERIGGLPAALTACMCEIGGASFLGDWAEINLRYEGPVESLQAELADPDPLCLPPAHILDDEWEAYAYDLDPENPEPPQFRFPFAPDEDHKANFSGGTHDIRLPDTCADPELLGVYGRPGVTLVEYLRTAVAWGVFPGWSLHDGPVPEALQRLRREPDF
jgi:hypothetical protein